MAKKNFDNVMKHVFKSEGGYSNNKYDPGGSTNRGITQRTFDYYCKLHNMKPYSVKNMTKDVAKQVYKELFWDKVKGDYLPWGIGYACFDFAVHSSPKRSSRYLQTLISKKKKIVIDGAIGPNTLAALTEVLIGTTEDVVNFANEYNEMRYKFLKKTKVYNQKDEDGDYVFRRGLDERMNDVKEATEKMIRDSHFSIRKG